METSIYFVIFCFVIVPSQPLFCFHCDAHNNWFHDDKITDCQSPAEIECASDVKECFSYRTVNGKAVKGCANVENLHIKKECLHYRDITGFHCSICSDDRCNSGRNLRSCMVLVVFSLGVLALANKWID